MSKLLKLGKWYLIINGSVFLLFFFTHLIYALYW